MKSSSSPRRSETIIGVDLASKCGWAVLKGAKRIDSGRWNLLPTRHHHRAKRWINLENNLRELVTQYNPQVIAFERVRRHMGTSAAHVYGGLLASMERLDMTWQRDARIMPGTFFNPEIVPIEISTWRKAACGRGNVDKLYVEKWVKGKFKYTADTDDEAEAIAIAEAVRRIRRGLYTP